MDPVMVDGLKVDYLAYADDVGATCNTVAGTSATAQGIADASRDGADLHINVGKTESTKIAPKAKLEKTTSEDVTGLDLDVNCEYCNKAFFTEAGLRLHKSEREAQRQRRTERGREGETPRPWHHHWHHQRHIAMASRGFACFFLFGQFTVCQQRLRATSPAGWCLFGLVGAAGSAMFPALCRTWPPQRTCRTRRAPWRAWSRCTPVPRLGGVRFPVLARRRRLPRR